MRRRERRPRTIRKPSRPTDNEDKLDQHPRPHRRGGEVDEVGGHRPERPIDRGPVTDSREQEEAAQTGGEGQDLRPPRPAVAPHAAQRVRPHDGGDRHTRRELALPPPRAPRRVQRVAHTGETADLRRLDQKLLRARHEQRRGTKSGGQVDGSARDHRPSPARHGRHDQAVKRAPHQHERRQVDYPLHRHGPGGRRAARLANPGESRPCGLAPVRRQNRERERTPQQVPVEVGERLPGHDVVAGHEAGPQADPHLAVVLHAELGRPLVDALAVPVEHLDERKFSVQGLSKDGGDPRRRVEQPRVGDGVRPRRQRVRRRRGRRQKTGGDQQEQDRGQRGPDSGPMHSRHRRLLPSGAPDGE